MEDIANRAIEWERKTGQLAKTGCKISMEGMNLTKMTEKKFNQAGNRNLNRVINYARIGCTISSRMGMQ